MKALKGKRKGSDLKTSLMDGRWKRGGEAKNTIDVWEPGGELRLTGSKSLKRRRGGLGFGSRGGGAKF